jgi:serine/threonine-protein kinase
MLVTPTIRLVKPLQSGGMGTLWLADHEALMATVVVKFMARFLANDPRAQTRFAREAAAASQLKSPHVVQIFDHGVTPSGLPYIVMEHLEGEDLGTRLAREGRLPPEQVVAIVEQVARALTRAEAKGIVHRDVKPENIFLVDVGGAVFAKLLDFGIARAEEAGDMRMTDTGAAIGTPYYMSPEQITGSKDLDHRSDVWSLAVVAIEALTGKQPFRGDTHGGVAVAIHSGALPVLSATDPVLFGPAADAWVARALARDVSRRVATAKELAVSLAEALDVVPARGAMASIPDQATPVPEAPRVDTRSSHPTAPLAGAVARDPAGTPRRRVGVMALAGVATLAAVGAAAWSRSAPSAAPGPGLSVDAVAATAVVKSAEPVVTIPTASTSAAVPVAPAQTVAAAPTGSARADAVTGTTKQTQRTTHVAARDAGARTTVTHSVETSDDDALK